jgi:zinc-ribbon domain
VKCAIHPDVDAVGVCISCGKAVCSKCRTVVGGKTYCTACAANASWPAVGQQTGKPVAGGILGIMAGVIGLALGFIFIAGGATLTYPWDSIDWTAVGLGISEVVFSVLAIIGSSFAIRRKNFTFSVIGGIFALLALWPLGIPALILIAMSRREFQAGSAITICSGCGRDNPKGSRFCMNCGRQLPE